MNTALIGYGHAGRVFHAPLIDSVKSLNLKMILSSKKDEIEAKFQGTQVISEIEEAFVPEIDLVVIATPNYLHFEQAKKAILAKKNVVVDKPFTVKVEEARELVELARQNNVLLSVFHNRRFDGDFLTINKLLNNGDLGRIVSFESNYHRYRPEVNTANWRETTDQAGGVFFDLGPHLIDQAISLFGPPLKVFCDLDCIREDAKNIDYFHVIFAYDKLRVHLNASNLSKNARERFVIQGTKGSYSKFGMDPQEANLKEGLSPAISNIGEDKKELYGVLALENESLFYPTVDGNYLHYYENISESILDHSKLEVTAEEGVFTMEIIELCLKSFKEKRWIELEESL